MKHHIKDIDKIFKYLIFRYKFLQAGKKKINLGYPPYLLIEPVSTCNLRRMWDEGSWWYAAPIGALSVNDNCIDFHVKPGKLGQPAIIDHFPKTEYISQLNKTTTVDSNIELKKLKIERDWVGRTNHFLNDR